MGDPTAGATTERGIDGGPTGVSTGDGGADEGSIDDGPADVGSTDERPTEGGDADGSDRADPLLAWSLASFHAALLVVFPVAAAHAIDPRPVGDLLGGLGTGVGFAVYLVLWGATWATNRRWLAGCDFAAPGRTILAGAKWGAPTGLAVLVALAVVLLVRVNPYFAALVAVVGGVLSLLVGAVVGALFAALDVVLYRLTAAVADRATRTRG